MNTAGRIKKLAKYVKGSGKQKLDLSPLLLKLAQKNPQSSVNKNLGAVRIDKNKKGCGAKRFNRFDRLMSKMASYNEFRTLVSGMLLDKDIPSPEKLETLTKSNPTFDRIRDSFER